MLSDSQLVQKIKRYNDKKAADRLFEKYYREIYAYVYKQCADKELAMDLTQDIFIAAFQGLPSFDEKRAAFRTWLCRIASNKVTDYYRSKHYKHRIKEVSIYDVEYDIADNSDFIDELISRENIDIIMNIAVEYDLQWVRIFQKKCFEDKTFSEISDELDLPVNTVKTRFYSIAKRLRKELNDER